MPVPLQGSQAGCLHQDLFASPHPTSTLKPNRVSVTTAQGATRARPAQEQVPKCHVCSGRAFLGGGGGSAELREAQGSGCWCCAGR